MKGKISTTKLDLSTAGSKSNGYRPWSNFNEHGWSKFIARQHASTKNENDNNHLASARIFLSTTTPWHVHLPAIFSAEQIFINHE